MQAVKKIDDWNAEIERLQAKMQEAHEAKENLENGDEREMLDASTVEWRKRRVKVVKGQDVAVPYVCAENTQSILDHYGYTLRYNEMKKDWDINLGEDEHEGDINRDTELNDKVSFIINKCAHHSYSAAEKTFMNHFSMIAGKNRYHPVKEWVESAEWDGNSRLEQFYGTIESDHPMKKEMMRKWLIQCIAAALNPNGIKAEGVLTFTGDQGVGKTTWVTSLTPVKEWVKDGLTLDVKNKDSVLEFNSYWIVELGEIGSTFKAADITSLKAFISRDEDMIRPPYARTFNNYARRTCFYGSVDENQFLTDKAGSRRFWTIGVDRIDFQHNINLHQLWAEARHLYLTGERFYMNKEEQKTLQDINKDEFTPPNPIHDILDRYVSTRPEDYTKRKGGSLVPFGTFLNATGILHNCGKSHVGQGDAREVTKWLKQHEVWFIDGEKQQHNTRQRGQYRIVLQEIPFNRDRNNG